MPGTRAVATAVVATVEVGMAVATAEVATVEAGTAAAATVEVGMAVATAAVATEAALGPAMRAADRSNAALLAR